MATNRTFTMIKPDAVKAGHTGAILKMINEAGFRIVAMKKTHLSTAKAGEFYAVHAARPFYGELVEFMSSGPIVAIRLEGDRVIEGFRALAGATDPTTAAPGTIRGDLGRDWGEKVQKNLVHGSDSVESATRELGIWFS